MNAKFEEARRLSEEKNLPFEYVKQMLEFAERAADNSIDFPKPPKQRPIPETTALFWASIAKEQFQKIMPDLDIPIPPVYTSTASSYSRTRRKIIKNIGCPHTEELPDSIMEYIHGETSNAILIRRELMNTSWLIILQDCSQMI